MELGSVAWGIKRVGHFGPDRNLQPINCPSRSSRSTRDPNPRPTRWWRRRRRSLTERPLRRRMRNLSRLRSDWSRSAPRKRGGRQQVNLCGACYSRPKEWAFSGMFGSEGRRPSPASWLFDPGCEVSQVSWETAQAVWSSITPLGSARLRCKMATSTSVSDLQLLVPSIRFSPD